ncbi:MAG: SUMF1/EgtB/PvdO family nonheme iron enzyme [Deltaproteobacteria bacterium]|nr:SUMF1/EgtB/PvdO family nonheme iron enzyme [bacterium]MCB9489123.1 SUMF1/EgtB/PvdO family nonheme iron enzyme [Deltaproteobacteria bacterium]
MLLALVGGVSCGDIEPEDDTDVQLDDSYGETAPGEMVNVEAGPFKMGSEAQDPSFSFDQPDQAGFTDERPRRIVTLSAFRIDRTEVTNAQYRACVADGACADPVLPASRTRPRYYIEGLYNDFPVVAVTWDQAAAYCAWAGKRLPTEAEWERAARGNTDTRAYPWGERDADCTLANIAVPIDEAVDDGTGDVDYDRVDNCKIDTTSVTDFAYAPSPAGALNMTGNVAEWVADFYASDYYDSVAHPDNRRNPTGPETGRRRVVRGGSFGSPAMTARVTFRESRLPTSHSTDIGFRCAADGE